MSSAESLLTAAERQDLLDIARASIRHGLSEGSPLPVDPERFAEQLREQGASFVTLRDAEGELRGCIGSLEAYRPLVTDVAENAFAAAFRDPRFAPLRADEFPTLALHISVLGPATPMAFADEPDLLRQLRPGVDGLILIDGGRRSTFLPSVWESLPQPDRFLAHLKRKAGLPEDYWSDRLRVWRYHTESFPEDAG